MLLTYFTIIYSILRVFWGSMLLEFKFSNLLWFHLPKVLRARLALSKHCNILPVKKENNNAMLYLQINFLNLFFISWDKSIWDVSIISVMIHMHHVSNRLVSLDEKQTLYTHTHREVSTSTKIYHVRYMYIYFHTSDLFSSPIFDFTNCLV